MNSMFIEKSEVSISSVVSRVYTSNYLDFTQGLTGNHDWAPYEEDIDKDQCKYSSEMLIYDKANPKKPLHRCKLYLKKTFLICLTKSQKTYINLGDMYLVRERYEHQKTDLYGFELKLGSFKAYMFSPSKTTSQKWVSLLKEHCVSDDFHSKFNIVSTLTEGTKERRIRIKDKTT
mmetsp:Transcript_22327/g.19224  ORF Transcript_22327/g.19224 Transcript_22327/m.19224 type:complete len:175 (-) Transcript_22327:1509-2033(-)